MSVVEETLTKGKNGTKTAPKAEEEPTPKSVNVDPTGTGPLTDRLARVMGKIGHVAKAGTAPAKMGGFAFVTESDVYNAVRKHLADEGIAVSVETKEWDVSPHNSGGKTVWVTKGLVRVSFLANDEDLTTTVPNYSVDYGDKGAQKLMSNAVKYAVLKTFLISTGEDDAETNEIRLEAPDFRPANQVQGAAPASASQKKALRGLRAELAEAGEDVEWMLPPRDAAHAETMLAEAMRRLVEASD